MIKEQLVNSVFYNLIQDRMSGDSLSPILNDSYIDASSIIDKILSLDPNKIGYRDIVSAAIYNDNISSIIALFSSLDKVSSMFINDYLELSSKYIALYEKMKRSLTDYKKRIDLLTDRLCIAIDHLYKNEQLESKCGHFGNYLTLPYFINTAKVYNSAAVFSIISTANIQYSNFANVTSLPFTTKPAFKISGTEETVTTNIKVLVTSDEYNALYMNIPSDKINSVKVNLYTTSGVITNTFDSGEILYTFDKCTLSSIEIVIVSNNYNPGKPYSMVISDMMLFNNLEFMPYGIFKSKAVSMDKIKNFDSLTLISQDTNKQSEVNIIQSLSISNDKSVLSYNKVDSDRYLDMSSYYLNKSKDILLSDGYGTLTLTYNDNTYDFYKVEYNTTDELWDMQYSKANIINGINSSFMDSTQGIDVRYENWTQEGNYYTTYLANFSDSITVNIGSKYFILNNKEVTGSVVIPFGISKIKVLEKDINFIDVSNKAEVVNETLHLNNFAYFFTGLPEYNGNSPILREKTFNINSQSVLYMNEPFISSGMNVYDNKGNSYRLHMSKNACAEGTYTVEPSKGIVKIYPYNGIESVTIRYYKSSQAVTPIGILFADLLTFAPITSLLDPKIGNTIFSIDGTYDKKVLYIPKAPRGPGASNTISHSQILYNNTNEPVYLSAMIEMQTSNKYISPAVKSITLSIK